jgi:glycosyltransferase involved in cell wall biosynthesis
MKPLVSVVICVRNGEKCVASCIESLLNQTYRDFEIVIVDDASNDRTVEIISRFKDQRIKCLRNKAWLGIPKSRNTGVKHAVGKYIFFTDADCTVSEDWIEEGLSCLTDNYQPAYSDYVLENRNGGKFMTANVAYRSDILATVGGLNEKIEYRTDRDLGFRVSEHGKVCFNKNMIAVHPQVTLTPKKLISIAKAIEDRAYLFRRFGDKEVISGRIMNPFNLAKIFAPELILASFVFKRFRKKEDYELLPYAYVYAVLERIHFWKACAKERVFLI